MKLYKGKFYKILLCLLIIAFFSQNLSAQASLKTSTELNANNLNLNFKNIPTRDLLRLLAESKGINIVMDDSVTGNISINLKNVSWEQAFDTILTMQGLIKYQHSNIWFINTIAQWQATKQAEQQLQPLQTLSLAIHYAKASDLANIIQNNKNNLLTTRGIVNVDARTNALWIQDIPSKLSAIKRFIADFDHPAKQVLIAARIVNVDQSFARELGLKFKTFSNTEQNQSNLNMDLPNRPQGVDHLNIAIAKLGKDTLIDLELAALEREGHGKIISNPRLITTNRQPAYIESGQEIPYQEKTSSGATNVSFKKAVLSLKVTPEITTEKKIILNLAINQDKASAVYVNGVPAINTQQIQSQVLVNNNDTIVIGGIYEQTQRNVIERIPFLGSIPIIGAVFSNKETILDHRELLVFITPKILDHDS